MPRTVLLLDHREDFRTALATGLRAAGLDVNVARDLRSASEALKTSPPTIMVAALDSRTRDDHLRLCREIKSDPHTKDTSLLLITEALTDEDVALATDPGALVLAVSPEDSAKLAAAIQGVLAGRRAEPLRASLKQKNDVKQTA
jgi:DNA-binding response OmpR family regulator